MDRILAITKHLSPSLIARSPIALSKTGVEIGEVVVHQHEHCITIVLQNPRVLNALNLGMVQQIRSALDAAEVEGKRFAILKGAGDRAFCAGGDIVSIAKSVKSDLDYCADFFKSEYALDLKIASYRNSEKFACVALLHGVVMGGGVGLANTNFCVGTETVTLAMPETGIGFFCDVGGSHFLSNLPRHVGIFMGLTGFEMDIADLLYCKFVSHFCPQDKLPELEKLLEACEGTVADIEAVLDTFAAENPYSGGSGYIERYGDEIDKCFTGDSVEEIYSNLQAHPNAEWASSIQEILNTKSPTSLKVVFECLKRGKALENNLADVFSMEFNVAMRFMQHPDFYEGVSSLLITKTKNPKWSPDKLSDVSSEDVQSFFNQDPDFRFSD